MSAPTPSLMIQGTGSDVGKSLLTAGLCRAYLRRGLTVRPFKPQNMSNNAAVTIEGGEIGRAQALQARACGVVPSVQMNPVLLKPETDTGAQIILQGKRVATLSARDWARTRETFLPQILESYQRICDEADLVLIEGAGSPAEINLREHDIANMGFARAANIPVILAADINRGGVIASIVGTLDVLDAGDAAHIKGFLINNFRGDVSLFDDGVAYLETRTGMKCAGIVPHFAAASRLPAEDALQLEAVSHGSSGTIHIAVLRLSRIANFDDLDPLRLEPDIHLTMVTPGEALPGDADLVIIPGTKSTIGDLAFIRSQGWDTDLYAHARRGGRILGLCGGYQLLGRAIHDPDGIEGSPGSARGLGLLDVETRLVAEKSLGETTGIHIPTDLPVTGYEIHVGQTSGPDRARPLIKLGDHDDGAQSKDGRIAGTYLHGFFAADAFRAKYLSSLGAKTTG
ncbi:MAG: cobyric acid synthase, partial [Fimbriimonadaceae bacterium]|nr:cobyric acid synthase [Alphaproteobacteria bacterium]